MDKKVMELVLVAIMSNLVRIIWEMILATKRPNKMFKLLGKIQILTSKKARRMRILN